VKFIFINFGIVNKNVSKIELINYGKIHNIAKSKSILKVTDYYKKKSPSSRKIMDSYNIKP